MAAFLALIALSLTAFGLVVLSSAGAKAPKSGGDPRLILRLQLYFVPVAVAGGLAAFWVNLEKLRRWVWWIYGAACVGLALVRIPGIGREVKGSWRWIKIPLANINVQVSDIARVALILSLAHYLAGAQRHLRPAHFRWFERARFTGVRLTADARRDAWHGFLLPCALLAGICGLIGIEPDLGTTALCAAVGASLLFVSGVRMRYLIPTGIAAMAVFAAAVYYLPTRIARILSFLDPEGLKMKEGYQLWQGMLSFACGGLNGEGLGQGIQQRHYLPEAHTDFIFPIIGEEFGLIATAAVAAAYLCMFGVVAWNLRHAHNLYQFNICLGAILFIVLQAVINMGVVTDLLPTKGMSLPFISYGGTNLVTMFVMLGLVLNCLRQWAGPPQIPVWRA
jgi:cell division protein FtsW